jgi:hypothetical protein
MRIFLVLSLFFSLTVAAQDEAAARIVFEKYISSIEKNDLSGLLSIMNDNFLKETGGKDHWKEVLKNLGHDYKGAKVVEVELKKFKGRYYARFNFRKKSEKEKPLSDKWFLLEKVGDKFLIHDFLDHFIPGEEVN